MSSSHASDYQQRVSSGAYEKLIANLSTLEARALISVEYKRDFYQDSKKGFMIPAQGDGQATPFKTWIFGEIAPRASGTLHQASGNHYFGKRPVCSSTLLTVRPIPITVAL